MTRLDLDQARLGLADFDLFCLVLPSSQNKQYQAWVSFSRIFLMEVIKLQPYIRECDDAHPNFTETDSTALSSGSPAGSSAG